MARLQHALKLVLEPIGVVRSDITVRAEAARQPRAAPGTQGRIELFPGRNFEHALEDLDGWEMIWVIFWFHLNPSWRPKVLPPRSTDGRKGVFSTRAPHRPNPLGLSAVRLERVEGLCLHVRDIDLLDGTPVLDIKPYVAYTDAYPEARSGWLDDAARPPRGRTPGDPAGDYQVSFEPRAAEQAAWVQARTGLPLADRITATLALGPQPHPYRRIRREGLGYRLAVKEWRIRFHVNERDVRVIDIASGFRAAQITAAGPAAEDPVGVHRDFIAAWPRAPV